MNEYQIKEFEKAVKPLMEYLAKNHNPHCSVIVTANTSEIVEGKCVFNTNEYLKD